VGEEPENERKAKAEDETSDDGKIKRGVLAAVNDVTRKFSQTEREFSAEVENSTDDHEETAEEKERAAEIAEGIHKSIIEEEPPGRSRADRWIRDLVLDQSFQCSCVYSNRARFKPEGSNRPETGAVACLAIPAGNATEFSSPIYLLMYYYRYRFILTMLGEKPRYPGFRH